jgi:POT family proton-dependent oligopeptide transporter
MSLDVTKSDVHRDFFKSKVLGHPSGLFVLFFTEMWERFSFYGMRILLVLFLTAPLISDNPGMEWSASKAGALYSTYAMLLYITPIFGGIIADKFLGYRWAVLTFCNVFRFRDYVVFRIGTVGNRDRIFQAKYDLYLI